MPNTALWLHCVRRESSASEQKITGWVNGIPPLQFCRPFQKLRVFKEGIKGVVVRPFKKGLDWWG